MKCGGGVVRAKASGEEDYGIDCGCVVLEMTVLDMKLIGDIVKAPEASPLTSSAEMPKPCV